MKAILMSIRPEWVAKILNGEKTIEIRKKFPKDYVGWMYIYCTKNGHLTKCSNGEWYNSKYGEPYDSRFSYYSGYEGKVVARFWCDKVEEILFDLAEKEWFTDTLEEKELLKDSCLSQEELDDYLQAKNGYAIHITKVEPFDKPKEISGFWTSNYNKSAMCDNEPQFPCTKCPNAGALYCNCKFLLNGNCSCISLTRAPQSWCYVEI